MEDIIKEAKTMQKLSTYWIKKRAQVHNLEPEVVRTQLVSRGIIDKQGYVL